MIGIVDIQLSEYSRFSGRNCLVSNKRFQSTSRELIKTQRDG